MLTTVDYMTDHEINWSFIVLLVVIYANVTLRLAIVGRNGYIFKIVSTFVFTVLFLEGIDLLTGASAGHLHLFSQAPYWRWFLQQLYL